MDRGIYPQSECEVVLVGLKSISLKATLVLGTQRSESFVIYCFSYKVPLIFIFFMTLKLLGATLENGGVI